MMDRTYNTQYFIEENICRHWHKFIISVFFLHFLALLTCKYKNHPKSKFCNVLLQPQTIWKWNIVCCLNWKTNCLRFSKYKFYFYYNKSLLFKQQHTNENFNFSSVYTKIKQYELHCKLPLNNELLNTSLIYYYMASVKKGFTRRRKKTRIVKIFEFIFYNLIFVTSAVFNWNGGGFLVSLFRILK